MLLSKSVCVLLCGSLKNNYTMYHERMCSVSNSMLSLQKRISERYFGFNNGSSLYVAASYSRVTWTDTSWLFENILAIFGHLKLLSRL